MFIVIRLVVPCQFASLVEIWFHFETAIHFQWWHDIVISIYFCISCLVADHPLLSFTNQSSHSHPHLKIKCTKAPTSHANFAWFLIAFQWRALTTKYSFGMTCIHAIAWNYIFVLCRINITNSDYNMTRQVYLTILLCCESHRYPSIH